MQILYRPLQRVAIHAKPSQHYLHELNAENEEKTKRDRLKQ